MSVQLIEGGPDGLPYTERTVSVPKRLITDLKAAIDRLDESDRNTRDRYSDDHLHYCEQVVEVAESILNHAQGDE